MSLKNDRLGLKEALVEMASLIQAYKPSSSIHRIELKIKPVDMLSWLSLQQVGVKVYGANQSDTMSIAGIGEAVSVSGRQLASFKRVFKKLRSYLSPQHPYLQWYGGFCFDHRLLDGDWKDFGAYRFVLPRFELAAREGKMIFCCNLKGTENIGQVLKELKAIQVPRHARERKLARAIKRSDKPDQAAWAKAVGQILDERKIEKVVLARKTSLVFTHVPDPWIMLRQLKSVTPNSYHFAFQFKNAVFLGASPERLYRRFGRSIESEALAGTMPKTRSPKALLASEKNKHEHGLVVDAISNALKQCCLDYQQQPKPRILSLASGYHLITKFNGQLKDGIHDEDILQLLHPTPALGGTPRLKAMALIRKLEGFSRGWYGAPIGYVGLDWAEFVVGIRSGLCRGKELSVFAGAGIVQGSEPQAEWKEVEYKISNFIKIIQ